ncbi:hypothetical protein N7481_006412 [Penicillium waksmanii]|uniref:uncharacterized protein n=1 Tax=Penicillium waksmanii TaxID=69791 RepID=UPI002547D8D3|nr:uncharacterized protein N7481_006412 [Penicillium waksmanii]KAJ5984313.1 hypothetical protein N7481_006412 [Penicillium waksmanii]
MTKPSLLELPPGVQLIYLAEAEQIGKLLRLRKQTASDVCYKEIAANFNAKIRPLFQTDELVDQTLIRLPDDLIPHCNQLLRAEERNGSRPAKRHGGYLALNEPFGLLITDMTVFNDADPGATLAEFKPKWLLQSPSAPVGAERCRTCALREMKNRDARGSRQKAFREVGLFGPEEGSRENSLDMTLRDCTMFIKIPRNESLPVEIRLGDLDLKTGAGGKAQYWRDLEHQLIDEGWYCTSGSDSSRKHSECALRSSRDGFNGNGVYST